MVETIFALDRNKNVIGLLSNNGVSPDTPFFDDKYTQELSNGAETYEFSTWSNSITSSMLDLGNYIVFQYDNKYKLFQIMDIDEGHKDGEQTIICYCEMAGLELLTDYCEPFSIEGNVELFFNTVLQDTNWVLGKYSGSLVTNIQQVKIDKYSNVYKVIQENLATFGNIEIEYRVEFDGNRLLGYFIDVYGNEERGNPVYKRFEYAENVDGISKKGNLYDFSSAMIGIGKENLTFKDIEWSTTNGDPANKPLGQDFIVDLEANDKFNKHGKYIKGLYENTDITNGQDLLLKTWERLQEVKEPKFDYEVSLALVSSEYEDIKIGDIAYVIDHDYNPPVFLEARVGKLELSFSDSASNKCTLSNYKEVKSGIKEISDITHEEVYDKLTQSGEQEFIYKDKTTGEIILNGNIDKLNVETIIVTNIESNTVPKQVYETTNISINSNVQNESTGFIDEAEFKSLQRAIDLIPKCLGGQTVNIFIKSDIAENIDISYFYAGRLRIYFEGHILYGYYRMSNCDGSVMTYGGTLDNPTGINGSIMPNIGYNHSSISTSVSSSYCNKSNLYSMKVYAATNLASECTENAAVCLGDNSYMYVSNVTPINCNYGFRANANAIIYSNSSDGCCDKYGFVAVTGGQIRLSNGVHTGGLIDNTYENSGGTVKKHGATFTTNSESGNNTSPPPSTTQNITYKSTSGNTYRSTVYYSWKNDNTVRQGDWGYGDSNGCWFFGSQFAELKGNVIEKVTIKISRTSGGISGDITHTLKAHNYSSKPSGMPSYLSGFSQTFSLATGNSTTITITDSTVLNAISNGTCKGFGLQSSYSSSYYSACSGNATVTITYR